MKSPECPNAGTRAVSFAEVLDGTTFRAADGSEVRLAGLIAPGAGGETRVNEAAARDSLAALLRTGSLTLAVESKPDRYGRTLAQAFADGVWLQGELLRKGLARAVPDLAGAGCAKALLQAENEGRQARAGHWSDGFAVLTPEQLKGRTGTFQIVEGKAVSASLNRGRAYINFGADYRTDFTVTVSPSDMRAFRQAKFDVKTLGGKHIRVRGWIEFYNGPEMEVATPAAIEVLD